MTIYTETETLAYLVYRLLEGDDVTEDAFNKLREFGFTDEFDEWINYE